MARTPDDRATRAHAILSAVEFSRSVNGYVLTSDQRNELLAMLEGDDESTEDASAATSKRTKR